MWLRPRIVVVKPRRAVGSGATVAAADADAAADGAAEAVGAALGAALAPSVAVGPDPAGTDGAADALGARLGVAGVGVGGSVAGCGVTDSTGPGVRSVSHRYLGPDAANVPAGPEFWFRKTTPTIARPRIAMPAMIGVR
jgi:hypothetical protein